MRILPRWLVPLSLTLAVIGLLVSAYLTWEHFTAPGTAACPAGEVINCAKVTQSSYAYLFGIPVAPLGLAYFVGVLGLSLPRAWQIAALDRVRLVAGVLGVALVGYLVWAEVAKIHAICLWCTVVHVATFLWLCAVVFGQIFIEPAPVTPTREAETARPGKAGPGKSGRPVNRGR